jgi:hypothetical protein
LLEDIAEPLRRSRAIRHNRSGTPFYSVCFLEILRNQLLIHFEAKGKFISPKQIQTGGIFF